MAEPKKSKEIKLKVAEAIQDDVNKGIVRIDSTFMKNINIKPGDIVEIEGERKTVAIVDRAYPGDIGLNIIRCDGIQRRNAKSGIGELVTVRIADAKEAKKVTIAPARKGVFIKASSSIFKQGLLGRSLVKGDVISLGGTSQRRTSLSHSPFFDDIFDVLDENIMGFGFSGLKFIVVDTNPKQPVIITESTEIIFNPEAVELVEEEAVPDISYEDVGGLNEEITKIREMVELPLKHPEIFERLGIEPPKGVLLHGPPGTGKTLLAKAVANETNSHFILINGPEIMSKFYGQSLPHYEKILIKQNGTLKRIPIGEIVNQKMQNLKVMCFDKMGKLIEREVSDLIKHKLHSKIMRIETKSGRHIDVTDDHSVFTMGEKGIESVKTSDLKAMESFIAVPNKTFFNKNNIHMIDLLDLVVEKDYGITIRTNKDQVKKAVKILGIQKAAKILDVAGKYVYDLYSPIKNIGIPVNKFLKLLRTANIPINKNFLQLGTKGKSMPAKLTMSEDLLTFFGLWMAEGSFTTKNEVRLSIHRAEEKSVADLCRKLFGNITIYHKPKFKSSDVIICSGILGKIMKHCLKFTPGSRNKNVPDFIFNLNKEHVAAFLRGYISGDGSLNTKTPAPMVEIATESPDLADDIAYLFLQFGIVTKIYKRPDRDQRRLCFADYENLQRFTEIGFLDSERNSRIYKYLNKQKFSRRDQIPLTPGLKNILKKRNISSWKNSKSIGKQVLQKLENPLLKIFTEGDIYWDKVKSINEVKYEDEYVYDISVPGAENFISGFGGIFAHNSEENIRKKFEDAEKNSPSIIFIDEIDAIASKREESHGEVERRVVAQLLALMDGLNARGKVVVIAATNIPNSLDPALRRPGRFDREIDVGVPSKEGRLNILKIHTRNMPLKTDDTEKENNINLKELARITHGFVGADLSSLAKEAAMIVLRRILPDIKLKEEEPISKDILERLFINQKDLKDALKVVRPSALREVLIEVPNVKWDKIGGLTEVKQDIIEAVEWPLKNPEYFTRMGIRPPRGILLFGAPGTGKTLLAKAVATESEANFISVKGAELLSKWVGESEKAVRKIFQKARQTAPSIIFFDEMDAIAPRRGVSSDSQVTERVVNQLLTEMDGLTELGDVVFVGATNRPDIIDPALLRPGRFDRLILCSPPDEKAREEIFKIHTTKMPLAKDVDLKFLSKESQGYVGSDIESICREAAMIAIRNDSKSKEVSLSDFKVALSKVRPSITNEIEENYKNLKDQFSTAHAKQMKKESPNYFG
tara:strand:+ start:4552 stop:8346 length:3795 start_codon:yes stop_codon:yes gene_type:complete